jgi:hypothetical protein
MQVTVNDLYRLARAMGYQDWLDEIHYRISGNLLRNVDDSKVNRLLYLHNSNKVPGSLEEEDPLQDPHFRDRAEDWFHGLSIGLRGFHINQMTKPRKDPKVIHIEDMVHMYLNHLKQDMEY